MEKKAEEPKDLQLKVGTKKEARWAAIKDKSMQENIQYIMAIEINETIIALAEKKIKEEQSKS